MKRPIFKYFTLNAAEKLKVRVREKNSPFPPAKIYVWKFGNLCIVKKFCHPIRNTAFPSAAIKGFSYNQPGHSCKDIRDLGDSTGDGEYWIDPEKNGKPLKVFCDMTTDEGKTWICIQRQRRNKLRYSFF